MPGMTIETLTLEKGFWRTHSTSTEILHCLDESHCKGGNSTMVSQCADGYTGPLCAVCDAGYAAVGSGETLSCNECNGSSTASLTGGIASIILIFSSILFFYCKRENIKTRLKASSISSKVETASSKFQKVGPIVKVIFAYFQVVGGLSFVFSMRFPPFYTKFMSVLGEVFSMDFISFMPLGCMTAMSFYNSLLFYTATPILISIVLGIYHRATSKVAKKNKIFEAFLIMTFVILPSVSVKVRRAADSASALSKSIFVHAGRLILLGHTLSFLNKTRHTQIFSTFACHEFDGSYGSYLKVDYSLDCSAGDHTLAVIWACCMIAVYPVGIPSMYFYFLWSKKDKLDPGQAEYENSMSEEDALQKALSEREKNEEEDPTLKSLSFLYSGKKNVGLG